MTITLPASGGDTSTLIVKFHRYQREHARPKTVAELIYPSGSHEVAESRPAVCDQFSKAVGRRVALRRVLQFGNVPRSTRKLIWAEYFKVHSDLKRNKPVATAPPTVGTSA